MLQNWFKSPGNNKIAPFYLTMLGLCLMTFASILIYICYVLLPDNGQKWVYLFGQKIHIEKESRLALLVILSGALGSFIHTATSFSRYIGHDKFYKRWIWWYNLRPFIGSALALIFYFVIRGGLFTSTSSDEINLYGILAISGLVGMFSKQATDKLDELFNNLFKTEREQDKTDSITGGNETNRNSN
jgi:hypothetical protein